MSERPRPLPIVLAKDDYQRLEVLARAEERDPIQQARWILRRALGNGNPDSRTNEEGTNEALG